MARLLIEQFRFSPDEVKQIDKVVKRVEVATDIIIKKAHQTQELEVHTYQEIERTSFRCFRSKDHFLGYCLAIAEYTTGPIYNTI